MTRIQEKVIISFSLPTASLTLHEPIFVDFSIHNRLAEGIQFDLGHNRKSNFEFAMTEPDGSVIQAPRLSEEGLGRIGSLSLGSNEVYRQRLLLNEWYHTTRPGEYKIETRLSCSIATQSGITVKPESSGPLSIHIHPRNPERLSQVCQTFTHIAIESSNVEKATEAALALSSIRDPIAVPYLAKALREGRLAWSYVIPGLGRIANAEAIEILILTMKRQDPESGSSLARFVLHEIKEKIRDLRLKEKIETALQS